MTIRNTKGKMDYSYSADTSSMKTLKLVLGIAVIVFLSGIAFWIYTNDSIINIDNLAGIENIPSEKNYIDIDEEIHVLNFSKENVSGMIQNDIYPLSESVAYDKMIFSIDGGVSWQNVSLFGDKNDDWIISSAKIPSLGKGYVGVYVCKKDTRIGALITGRWDCNWVFKNIDN